MNTDRELIIFSAKAYGITLEYRGGSDAYYYDDPETGREEWFPLGNYRQTLQLAVKLKIDILNHESFCGANAGELDFIINEDHMDDPLLAACRAVTRAAAEIGRAMP